MIDLTNRPKTYEIKWFDGQLLHLKLPSQELLLKILEIEDIEDDKEQFTAVLGILGEILNSNTEGRQFTEKEISEIPLDVIEMIFTDYVGSTTKRLGE